MVHLLMRILLIWDVFDYANPVFCEINSIGRQWVRLYALAAVKEMLDTKKFKTKRNTRAVGVAGTMTSLAAIDLQIDEYDPEHMNGHVIVSEKLKKGIEIFSLHTHQQLLELSPKVMKGREDIFLAGLLILEGFLNYFGLEEIKVSTGGIRHGALIHDVEND